MNALRKLTVSTAAYLLVTALALAAAVWQGTLWFQDHRYDERRQAAVEVAEDQVLDLTTLDSKTVDAKLKAMGERLSGDFKRQFDGFSETFAGAVTDEKISAAGTVRSVAVSSYDDDTASVLVATRVQVSNGDKPETTQRDYRMRVLLGRDGDVWLVTGMEFVR
jgi:Mce-associated membrane protein